jgi:hypothetical protein
MVAINSHDHDDGNVCPACRFRKALAGFLAQAHEDGREEWHWAVGDLRRVMHTALLAIDQIDAAAFTPDEDATDDDPVADAAEAVVQVGAEIEQLWHMLLGRPE